MKQFLRLRSLRMREIILTPLLNNGWTVRAYCHNCIDPVGQSKVYSIDSKDEDCLFYKAGYRISHVVSVTTKDPLTNRLTVNNKEWV